MAAIAAGVDRANASSVLTCADLFCGAGGFSEGFRQAGYQVTKALDIWAPAVLTHERNLPDTEAIRADILSFDPERIGPVDVLIGSPPCTEFSFANRGGSGDVEQGMRLVYRFLRFVYELRPRWWVMENVPRVLDFLPEEIPLRKLGIDTKGSLAIPVRAVLVSADYGAPQKRARAFSGRFPVPAPTHAEPAPPGELPWDALGDPRPRWRTLRDIVETLPDPLRVPRAGDRVRDPVYGFELPASELTDHFADDLELTPEEVRENRKAKADHSWYGRMSFPDELDRPARTVMATNLRVARETTVIPSRRDGSSADETRRRTTVDADRRHRRLSVRESSSVQGFPITYQWWGATASLKYKLVGNAVAPPVAYAIAREIVAAARAPGADASASSILLPDRPYVVTHVIAPAPEARLSRDGIRSLPLDRRFREHVLRLPGHRVDLDNRGERPGAHRAWTVRGGHPRHLARWRAVHYRGGGKMLRHGEVTLRDALRLLAAAVRTDGVTSSALARADTGLGADGSERRARRFVEELDRTFPSTIPDASTLQAIRAERMTGAVTPYVVLERIVEVVARHFPTGAPIRVRRRGHRELVPPAIAAALVATAYACEIANRSGEWIAAHRDEAYRPTPEARAHSNVHVAPAITERLERLVRPRPLRTLGQRSAAAR